MALAGSLDLLFLRVMFRCKGEHTPLLAQGASPLRVRRESAEAGLQHHVHQAFVHLLPVPCRCALQADLTGERMKLR